MSIRFSSDIILLAAGLGTRMMPLTRERPKPLIPVGGMALIERVVINFRREGFTSFVANAHTHADQIEAAIRQLASDMPGTSFGISREDEILLNTGGGAKKALSLTHSDPVFVVNTDAFWQGKDRPLERMHQKIAQCSRDLSGTIILLCAHPARSLGFRRSHDFCLNPQGEVTMDSGVPVIYAGVALMPRSAFAQTPDRAFSLNLIFEHALEKRMLFGVLLDTDWYHVGDPQALNEAETHLGEL